MTTPLRQYVIGECRVEIFGGQLTPPGPPPPRWLRWLVPVQITWRSCGCSDADFVPVYVWLAMAWLGWPLPLRVQLVDDGVRVCFTVKRHTGCGCIKRIKDATTAIAAWLGEQHERFNPPGSLGPARA